MPNKIYIIAVFFFFLIFAGCAPQFKNMQIEDIKQDRHFYKQWVIERSLAEITSQVEKYNFSCRPRRVPQINPNNPKKGMIRYFVPGWSDYSVIGLLEFTEDENGTTTTMDAYFYYFTWKKHADNYIKVIENPDECL